jgi:tetratricopeptide (TPR) repeat protein
MSSGQLSSARSSFLRTASLVNVLGGLILAMTAMTAGADVDFGKANDYYAARASSSANRVMVVEQYHLGPGEQALHSRKYAKAFSEFTFILNIFPNHPKALSGMLQVCERWKSPQCRSEEFLAKAISINPNASGTYVVQGIHLHRTRQYPKAIESYQRALEIDPDSAYTHYNIGLTYLETKQYALANEHAQRAYALGASLPGLRKGLERVGQWKSTEKGAATAPPAEASDSQGADDRSAEASKK